MPVRHNLTSRVGTPQLEYTLDIRLPGGSWQLRLTGHPGHQLWSSLRARNLMCSPRAPGPTFPHMPIPQRAPSRAQMEGEDTQALPHFSPHRSDPGSLPHRPRP